MGGSCVVKRYDYNNVEIFDNHDNICNKNIYSNLFINGYGEYGNNLNFSSFTYNKDTNDFKIDSSEYFIYRSDNYVKIDFSKKYYYSIDAYNVGLSSSHDYIGLSEYDIDNRIIYDPNIMYIDNTLTTLAKNLNNGDTVVYFNDLSNWLDVDNVPYYQRGFIFWNYKDSTNYMYPPLTYSYNYYYRYNPSDGGYEVKNINKSNNSITLSAPWDGGFYPAGTFVSESNRGSNGNYSLLAYSSIAKTYTKYSANITGVNQNNDSDYKFRPGSKYVKVLFELNYLNSGITEGAYTYIKDIILEETD